MTSLPLCEALAADPAHYMFKTHLEWLKNAPDYQDKRLRVERLQGHLVGLLEAGAITVQVYEAAYAEAHAFVWGPRP